MAIRRALTSISVYVILVIFGLFFLVPLLWPILASLNPNASLSVAVPAHFSLINFQTIISNGLVAQPFANSLILAISTMFLVIILASLAAYPLSRYHFSFKGPLMYAILFASALPVLALVTPLYAMYASLNLIDTLQGVILFFVASALPFCIWLMKNFLDSVPVELEEAAWIDGASTFQGLIYVLLPLAAPGIAVVGVWSFLDELLRSADYSAKPGFTAGFGAYLHVLRKLRPGELRATGCLCHALHAASRGTLYPGIALLCACRQWRSPQGLKGQVPP
jgi:multiple sugar transport system permease protein